MREAINELSRRLAAVEADNAELEIREAESQEAGTSASEPMRAGLVVSGTAATYAPGTQTIALGTVTVRELIAIAAFDQTQPYAAGDVTRLDPPEFSASATYFEHDIVQKGGQVYQAKSGLAAGGFNAADWTLIGAVGTVWECQSGGWAPKSEPTPADDFPGAWNELMPTPDEIRLGEEFTFPYRRTTAPEAGELIKWRGDEGEWIELGAASESGGGGGIGNTLLIVPVAAIPHAVYLAPDPLADPPDPDPQYVVGKGLCRLVYQSGVDPSTQAPILAWSADEYTCYNPHPYEDAQPWRFTFAYRYPAESSDDFMIVTQSC